MINTNTKKKSERKAVMINHNDAVEKTTCLSETWETLFEQISDMRI